MTGEELKQVEELANAYMTKEEICIITGINPTVFDDDIDLQNAFDRGRLKRKAQFHLNITRLSDQLSSPAQALEAKLAEETRLNDLKR